MCICWLYVVNTSNIILQKGTVVTTVPY